MDFNDEMFINDVKKMDVFGLVSYFRYVSNEVKKELLNNTVIRDKLRSELLDKCNEGDVYRNFRWLFDIIDIDDFFNVFDYDSIHFGYGALSKNDFPDYMDAYRKGDYDRLDKIDNEIGKSKDRNQNEYKLFVCLMEKDINKSMEYILNDNSLFKEVMLLSDNMYSMFGDMDYEYVVKMIYRLEENNFFDNNIGLNVISSIGSDNQKKLLDEGFSDDTLLKIIPYFRDNVISYFFKNDKRAIYLYNKFSNGFIVNCVNRGIEFNREILLKDDFFNRLKSSSFVNFRRDVNAIEKNNDYLIIEKKVFDYYKEIISKYDYNTELFSDYSNVINDYNLLKTFDDSFIFNSDVRFLFSKYIDYDNDGNVFIRDVDNLTLELKEFTSKRISDVVVDFLFCDNIYNVWLNIKEMLRFNDKLDDNNKVLDDDRVNFYKMILSFDSVSSSEKIELFNKFCDKNFSFIFYDDLRKLKNLSYDMIKSDLLDLSNYKDCIIDNDKDVLVYDLRDKKYNMFVRTQYSYRPSSGNRRDCYSLISDENSVTYGNGEGDSKVIYGYNSFDNDTVVHVLEQDAFSSDLYGDNSVSRYVNRIMTSREIINGSSWYSEIELVNKRDGSTYIAKKPDYIVTYDEIRDIDIIESKRLNIPIVIISRTRIKTDIANIYFGDKKNVYINSSLDEKEYRRR